MNNSCDLIKTVVFDFDGVVHSYKSGWKGIDVIPDEPVHGIRSLFHDLTRSGWRVVIVSTRCATEEGIKAVKEWLKKNDIYVYDVCKEKPPAICYVDDRAICFEGDTSGLFDKIQNFRTWQEERN